MNNEPIKIKVTNFQIFKGIRENCSYCPIALAIADAMHISFSCLEGPISELIKVYDSTDIEIRGKRYYTDKKADEFIGNFDRGKEVEEIELTLYPYEKDEDDYEF